MQHDVLAALDLFDAVDAHQQPARSNPASRRRSARGADQRRLALQHRPDLAQVIGRERRSGGDQVADQIGAPEARRDLDRAGQHDDLGTMPRSARNRPRMCG